MSHVHKIAISMSPEVLRRLDQAVSRSEHSRSRFVQVAVEAYLDQQEAASIQQQLNDAFADDKVRDEQHTDSESFLGSIAPEEPW